MKTRGAMSARMIPQSRELSKNFVALLTSRQERRVSGALPSMNLSSRGSARKPRDRARLKDLLLSSQPSTVPSSPSARLGFLAPKSPLGRRECTRFAGDTPAAEFRGLAWLGMNQAVFLAG